MENLQELLSRLSALEERLDRLEKTGSAPAFFHAGSRKSFGGKTKDLTEPTLLAGLDLPVEGRSRLVVWAGANYQAGSRVNLHLGKNVSSDALRTDFECRLLRGEKGETFLRAGVRDSLVSQRPLALLGAVVVREAGTCRVEFRFTVAESDEPFDQFVRVVSPQLYVWRMPEEGER